MNKSSDKSGKPNIVYLNLGSNIEPEKNIPLAVERLQEKVHVSAVSSIWETPPVGTDGGTFFNLAMRISTDTDYEQLKFSILRIIEEELGRKRGSDKFAPRTIDIDIEIFNEKIIDSELWMHPYTAIPMAEILPDLRHPLMKLTLKEAARQLAGKANIIQRTDLEIETNRSDT